MAFSEVVSIIGRGPSLLDLTANDIPEGDVITLNRALVQIRRLNLHQRVFTMQKDGCVQALPGGIRHGKEYPPTARPILREHWCSPQYMLEPREPEILLVTTMESPFCFYRYPHRILINVGQVCHVPWWTPSAPVAVAYAAGHGAKKVVMFANDAYTKGTTLAVEDDNGLLDLHDKGYFVAGQIADRLAHERGIEIEWR